MNEQAAEIFFVMVVANQPSSLVVKQIFLCDAEGLLLRRSAVFIA